MSKTHNIPEIGEFGSADRIPAKVQLAHVTVGASGADVNVGATGAYTLFNADEPAVVTRMWTRVETAFNASVTLDIGDSGSASRFDNNATIAPQSTGSVLVAANGLTVPYVYGTAQDILITVGGAAVTTGLLHVYAEYAVLAD